MDTEERTASKNDQVNELYVYFSRAFDSSSDDIFLATIFSDTEILEPIKQKATIGTAQTMIMVDSCSVCTIINERLACREAVTDEFQSRICRASARELRKRK